MTGGHSPMSPPSGYAPGRKVRHRMTNITLISVISVVNKNTRRYRETMKISNKICRVEKDARQRYLNHHRRKAVRKSQLNGNKRATPG